jgi:inner membrane protein
MISPLFVRALLIVFVTILILGAISLIDHKINERAERARQVEETFSKESVGTQAVAGPFLLLTCERRGRDMVSECQPQVFVPKTLTVKADVPVEARYRGIYPIRLYKATMQLSGQFEWPVAPLQDMNATNTWKHAYLVASVSDPRGIKSLSIPGNALTDTRFAIRQDLGPAGAHKPGDVVPFDFSLTLAGTGNLTLTPIADSNELRVTSTWPHPSFQGHATPEERTVTASGFEAVWRISGQATGGEPAWQMNVSHGSLFQRTRDVFQVGFGIYNPLDVYALSFRATQYAFLFLLFTFSALALTEVLAGVKLHAIQYLLVGSALAVFFLLLIALSEHIAFARAYLAASVACATLLTIYLRHPLGTLPRTAGFFAMFAALYGTLYVLLQSEDHAMLMGSLLVFAVLALTMLTTRRTDWSEVSRRMRQPVPPAVQPT